MAQQQSALSSYYSDLHRLGEKGEWERAVKIANKLLNEYPNEEKAFHCKMVCLIQVGKFDEALTAIHKNQSLSGNLTFERAYCEYRLNRNTEALSTLKNVTNPDARVKELLAQVLYKLEDYDNCFEVYKDLVKNTQDDFEDERETNLSAVMAALQNSKQEKLDTYGLRADTYELCFNEACFLIGNGQYEAAIEKLKTSEALCRELYEDDPEEDIENELAGIHVQMGYCHQKLGRFEDAMKLYNQVIKQKPTDLQITAVASNNIVTLNKEQNVFDSKKKIKTATADNLTQKLTSGQKKTISTNQCLLYMYMNQADMCLKTAATLQKVHPEDEISSLIVAAQHVRDKQVATAIQALKTRIDAGSSQSLSLKLTLAQLYLSQGSVFQTCDILQDLGDHSFKMGVISALVTLYLNQEDKEAASDVLNKAVTWYKKNMPGSEELVMLMRSNANFQLRHGDPKVATKMLEELRKKYPKDLKTLAQLISAYSKFDPKKAQEVSKDLPSMEEHDIDLEALEASVGMGSKYIKKVGKVEQSPKPKSPEMGDNLIQKKKKKNKKGKLPKNMNPEVAPDPERWLPKRERSYFRGKRRDKKKEISKGPQGAMSASLATELDASKSPNGASGGGDVGSPKPGSVPLSGPGSQPPSGPRKQQMKNKKKKKGGKW